MSLVVMVNPLSPVKVSVPVPLIDEGLKKLFVRLEMVPPPLATFTALFTVVAVVDCSRSVPVPSKVRVPEPIIPLVLPLPLRRRVPPLTVVPPV